MFWRLLGVTLSCGEHLLWKSLSLRDVSLMELIDSRVRCKNPGKLSEKAWNTLMWFKRLDPPYPKSPSIGGINYQAIWFMALQHRSPRWNPRASIPWWPDAQGGMVCRFPNSWAATCHSWDICFQVQKLMTIFIEESKVKPQAWRFLLGQRRWERRWESVGHVWGSSEFKRLRTLEKFKEDFGEWVWAAKM